MKDGLKEEINTLRLYSLFFITSIFSLIAYMFNSLIKNSFIQNITLFIVLNTLIIIYLFVTIALIKKTKELKELK